MSSVVTNEPVGVASVLTAESVYAGYGDADVIRDVTIEIRPGELVALLGPNGAGKTTLLLALCGQLPLRKGVVTLSGTATRAGLHRRARAGLSLIPEQGTVCASLSVEANLRVSRCDRGLALEMFPELRPLLQRRGGLLSGGEQRILSVACALARRPSLILADELSMGLAPLLVERLINILKQATEAGVAVLLVEQHVRQVLEVAERAYILRRGRIVLEGGGSELLGRIEEIEDAYLASSRVTRDEAGG